MQKGPFEKAMERQIKNQWWDGNQGIPNGKRLLDMDMDMENGPCSVAPMDLGLLL